MLKALSVDPSCRVFIAAKYIPDNPTNFDNLERSLSAGASLLLGQGIEQVTLSGHQQVSQQPPSGGVVLGRVLCVAHERVSNCVLQEILALQIRMLCP